MMIKISNTNQVKGGEDVQNSNVLHENTLVHLEDKH